MATAPPADTAPADRIRVVMLIGRFRRAGGAETVVAGLATHLPRERYEVTVCSTRKAGDRLADLVEEAGIRHLSLDRRSRWQVHRFRHLVSLLRRERIDVLHSHMFGSNMWGVLIGRACRVRAVIAHEHGSSYRERWRRVLTRHVVARLADRIVTVSAAERRRLVDDLGVDADKVAVVPNAYVPRPPAEGDLRRELSLGAETPVVGTIAQLRPEKALDLLIDAFVELCASLPDAVLVIAGSGHRLKGRLLEHAAATGLAARIHLLGYREDVDVVLRGLDVAAISSDREGSPLFACECMAHRVPLVATDVGGVREMVADAGVLVPPRDPSALASALGELLRDTRRRAELADRGSRRLEHFSIERMVGDVSALYREVLAEPDGARA